MSGSSNYCGKCKNVISATDTVCEVCGSLISEVGMGCSIDCPTVEATFGLNIPGIIAIQKGGDGKEKIISYTDAKLNITTNFHGGICEESSEVDSNNTSQKRDAIKEDRKVVKRLLPFLNEENNSHFTISGEIPEKNSINDVFIEEVDTGNKLGVQVTFSDGKALEYLHKKRSLNRRGDADTIFDGAIKQAVEKRVNANILTATEKKRYSP